jgi:hypothetical protein
LVLDSKKCTWALRSDRDLETDTWDPAHWLETHKHSDYRRLIDHYIDGTLWQISLKAKPVKKQILRI